MRCILLLTISFALLPFTAFGEIIGGEMRCTIRDEVIKQMDDGKASSFSSYKDDLTVGGKFTLNYSINSEGTFLIETEGPKQFSEFEHSFDISLLSNDTVLEADKKYNYIKALYAPIPFLYLDVEIRKDQFQIGYVGESVLSMRRYYKSDWMAIYTMNTALTNSPIIAHTYSFNCTHSSNDKWADVFEKVMSTALSRTQ
jgi:hypothetical protein